MVLDARDVWEIGHPESSELYVADVWRNPRFEMAADTLVVAGPTGEVVAYADVSELDDPQISSIWGPVHPEHRGRGIGTALLGWAEARARRSGSTMWHAHTTGGDEAAHALLAENGYELVRSNLHMLLDLDQAIAPVEQPKGVRIRTMWEGDERAVHHVVAEAFRGHFALMVDPFDQWWAQTTSHPSFERSLFWIAEDDRDGIVGASCNFVEEPEGWVGELGVLEAHRGRGIAKALLVASFRDFAGRGLARARLNVDAQNETGAVDLYRAVGMREHRRFPIFEKRSWG